ncbi:MAG: Hsp70 family protein [Archangium sp.]
MATPLYLGIDLGTTNSTAAAFDGEHLTLIRNAQGANLTPSVVRLDARGAVTVGDRARRLLDSDPLNTRSEFKRLMGTAMKRCLLVSILLGMGCAAPRPIPGVVRPEPGAQPLESLPLRSPSPPPVPVEDDKSVRFPRFFEQQAIKVGARSDPYELDGVTLRAIQLAANDFLPPGSESQPCEDRQEAQHYRVIRQGDVVFVYIYEDPKYCGFSSPALDSGAKYAISTDGRILRRVIDGQPEEPFEPVNLDAGGWVPARPGVPSGYDAIGNAPSRASPPEPPDGGTAPSQPVSPPASHVGTDGG